MSNHIIKKDNRGIGKGKKDFSTICKELITLGIFVYVQLMLIVFPLYYQDKYYNMGEAKYAFFKRVSLSFLSVLIILVILNAIINIRKFNWSNLWKVLSVTDKFVLLYAIAVWISFILTPYKADAVWGYEGWYMGIVSQMLFVIIYFLVSRFLDCSRNMLHMVCAVSAIVFLLAVLHRFQIDPLHMYEGLTMNNKILFLSTMGQATWYSSYLCIVFPIGLYLYWSSTNRIERILYGIYVALGFSTMVTQNSDSAFVAFGLILLVLFTFSYTSNDKLSRFLEIVIIGLAAMRIIGILQTHFPDAVVPLEELSIRASQGNESKVLLLVTLLLYVLLRYFMIAMPLKMAKHRKYYIIIPIISLTVIVSVPFLVYLNTKDMLPAGMSFLKKVNYFIFNDDWGNGRGFTWRCSAEIFKEYSLKNKFFGCGPDCFASYAYDRYADTLSSRWGNDILTNAHNEWFTSLLYFGYLGAITYLSIFVTEAVRCMKLIKKEPFLLVGAMCIVAYVGHNFFCYQQIICTPIIFIFMGMMEYKLRGKRENRHAL
ncbi:MAG: O-antigen ligase family protein [Lachnospiraceae bacterium]|nr:O-antigen ligase family protein [Lachnospiraceae bacterium]